MASKNKIKAFSLIEIIVWITISVLLMVSIWVFVTSWMQNIFSQQKVMDESSKNNDFFSLLYEVINNIEDKNQLFYGEDFIVFKWKRNYDSWWFTYIWVEEKDSYYCLDTLKEKHIFIKNFIPFIEEKETINNLNSILESQLVKYNWKEYKSIQKEHKIVSGSWKILIWRWVFWSDFEEWQDALKISLNSPTWLATDWEVLYFSDTLNDRVLYMKDWKVYKLLDETDWLKEPTWLHYDENNKALYIANSWKGEVLSFSSQKLSIPTNLKFSQIEGNSVWKIKISFFRNNELLNISPNLWVSKFSFLDSQSDLIFEKQSSLNSLVYDFKKEINNSGSISKEDYRVDFYKDSEYSFDIQNTWDFLEEWVYTYEIELWNSKNKYYYFTQWDGKVYTKGDNTLERIHYWLSYPTWIWWKDSFNDFVVSKDKFAQKLWWVENTITKLKSDEFDIITTLPVDSFLVKEKNSLITIIIKYFKSYNCENLDENSKNIRTYINKIDLK